MERHLKYSATKKARLARQLLTKEPQGEALDSSVRHAQKDLLVAGCGLRVGLLVDGGLAIRWRCALWRVG